MGQSPEVEIAVLKSEMMGLREQSKVHAEDQKKAMTDHRAETKEAIREIKEDLDEVKNDVKQILGVINQSKGGMAVALIAAGAVGSIFGKLLGLATTILFK